MKKPPLVEVTWHDAFLRSSCATQADAEKDDDYTVRVTVGWLVTNNDKKVVVAMTIDPPGLGEELEFDDRYTIPKKYVDTVRYVERGPRKPKQPKEQSA